MMQGNSYIWEDDPVSASLIEKMQHSDSLELEAKEYLRPIFKWTKQGGRSYNVDQANAFAEYLVMISRVGDAERNILRNKSIQAKYAFNILITMAQRRGSSSDAWLSYLRIVHHGFEPDVFTMTALIGKYDHITQRSFNCTLLRNRNHTFNQPLISCLTSIHSFRCYR